MASARNLCQHSDIDGTICTSNDYIHCPHCQLQLCLKHLNFHQELLRSDCQLLSDQINRVRCNFDQLKFDSNNHRQILKQQLDYWHFERISYINKMYLEKQQQLDVLCSQAQIEFDMYKTNKEKLLKENLLRRWNKVLQQKQINIEDLQVIKNILNNVEHSLDELKKLLIDVVIDPNNMNINIIKHRYVEASKTSFNDDDDQYLFWDIQDDENNDVNDQKLVQQSSTSVSSTSSSDVILSSTTSSLSPESTSTTSTPTPTENRVEKVPLKLIIKRLQQPSTSKTVKYKLQTVATSTSLTV